LFLPKVLKFCGQCYWLDSAFLLAFETLVSG